jgi:hypothetical protein
MMTGSTAMDIAIRARREAYVAGMDALQLDVDTITERVTPRPSGA